LAHYFLDGERQLSGQERNGGELGKRRDNFYKKREAENRPPFLRESAKMKSLIRIMHELIYCEGKLLAL